jgi:hypothetical protein
MSFTESRSSLIMKRIGSGRASLLSKKLAQFRTVPRFWDERFYPEVAFPSTTAPTTPTANLHTSAAGTAAATSNAATAVAITTAVTATASRAASTIGASTVGIVAAPISCQKHKARPYFSPGVYQVSGRTCCISKHESCRVLHGLFLGWKRKSKGTIAIATLSIFSNGIGPLLRTYYLIKRGTESIIDVYYGTMHMQEYEFDRHTIST